MTWARRQDPDRLVFVDEAGANLAMGRSHVWVQRGEEYVEPRPMNWGDNLTLVGAIRRRGWVALSTKWCAMNRVTFVDWVRRRLAPRLRRGDIVVLDNLQAHRAPEVRFFIEQGTGDNRLRFDDDERLAASGGRTWWAHFEFTRKNIDVITTSASRRPA